MRNLHLVLVILAARRNKVVPLHGAASHHIHNAEGHAHGCRGGRPHTGASGQAGGTLHRNPCRRPHGQRRAARRYRGVGPCPPARRHRSGQHPVRQGIDPLPQSRERRRQSRQMAPLRTDQRVQGHHSGVRRVRCLRFPEKPGLRTGPMPPQRFSVDRHRQDAASRAGLPRHGRQHLRHQGRGRGADRDAHRMPGLQRQAFLCGG